MGCAGFAGSQLFGVFQLFPADASRVNSQTILYIGLFSSLLPAAQLNWSYNDNCRPCFRSGPCYRLANSGCCALVSVAAAGLHIRGVRAVGTLSRPPGQNGVLDLSRTW
jgi:hypothetical protein